MAAWRGAITTIGWLDAAIAGWPGTSASIAKVYRNNGNGTFTDIGAGLTGVSYGSVAWGDYNNDGDLDILLTGSPGGYPDYPPPIAKVYRNNGNGTFSSLGAGLTEVYGGSAAWGDSDNDGRPDILLTGYIDPETTIAVSQVYHNNGNGSFYVGAELLGVGDSAAAWADYNNDARLDVLLTGWAPSYNNYVSKLYRNDTATANSAPGAPSGLSVTPLSTTSAVLSWNAPGDAQTATAGLSYNLRVGTTPGGGDVVGPMADPTTGLRRLAARGMIQGTSWTLTNLTPGQTYYWSVQAVDSGFLGSPFAAEGTFTTFQERLFDGTPGPDRFYFFTNGLTHTVVVNGATQTFDASLLKLIRFDGLGANDEIAVYGGPGPDTAFLGRHQGQLVGPNYRVEIVNTEKITIVAGSGTGHLAYLEDAPGNDRFYAMPTCSYMLYADGSQSRVYNFNRVEGRATLADGDLDTAYFYDSAGNDTYTGAPGASSMTSPGVYENTAAGFEQVYARSTASTTDYDTATIQDSSANDTFYFYGSLGVGYMKYGTGGFNHTTGFNKVEAHSTAGSDTAILYDSAGNDAFEARDDHASMTRTDTGAAEGWVLGFPKVYAYASTGNDTADLYDSSGNDTLYAWPRKAQLIYENGRQAVACSFDQVTAHATLGAEDLDMAWMYDSPANDVYAGTRDSSTLEGLDLAWIFKNIALGFDRVYALATVNGATDLATITDSALVDYLYAYGKTNEAYIKYGSVTSTNLNYAKGFDKVTLKTTTGGIDTAVMVDSNANDTFTGDLGWAQMLNDLGTYFFRIEGLSGGPVSGDRVWICSQNGGSDRYHRDATIDYVLRTVGLWTIF